MKTSKLTIFTIFRIFGSLRCCSVFRVRRPKSPRSLTWSHKAIKAIKLNVRPFQDLFFPEKTALRFKTSVVPTRLEKKLDLWNFSWKLDGFMKSFHQIQSDFVLKLWPWLNYLRAKRDTTDKTWQNGGSMELNLQKTFIFQVVNKHLLFPNKTLFIYFRYLFPFKRWTQFQ